MPLSSDELRKLTPDRARKLSKSVKRFPLFFILEDIIDTYNVGAFFRLAEAVAAKKIYLTGRTETPPNPRTVKSSVGTYKLVPWEYKQGVKEVLDDLKKINNLKVCAVEQNEKAIDYRQADYQMPLAFIFGNESFGVSSEALKAVDFIVEVPMYGLNGSLNVMAVAAVVTYWMLKDL